MKITKTRRSGFTLVELLIVIMIIAILAGMLLLATGGATDSAKATRVINDLRSVKSAAMMMMMDSPDDFEDLIGHGDPYQMHAALSKYTDRPLMFESGKQGEGDASSTLMADIQRATISHDGDTVERVFLVFHYAPGWDGKSNESYITQGVANKLAQQAEKVGLYSVPFGGQTSGNEAKKYDGKNDIETVAVMLR